MKEPRLVLTEKGYRRYLTGHPWIYRGDIGSVESAASGDVVRLEDTRGRALGFAFYSAESLIAVRIISRTEEPTPRLFRERIQRAIDLRRRLYAERGMERLVHGESDGLPGLVVDRYGDVLVLQTLVAGMERMKESLVALLRDLLAPRAIIERNDPSVRKLEGLPVQSGYLWGERVGELACNEGRHRVIVKPLEGQKTGLFLDQQENHEAAARWASGRVLDGFAYQGGFALQVADRAEHVVAVEASADALTTLRENCRANGVSNVEAVEANVFDHLTERSRLHERFDTVILDPPAFAKNRESVPAARRGYKEINLRAMSLLGPGGILITCSCSYHLKEPDFLELLSEAARDRGLQVQLLEKRIQARDHPVLLSMPESLYLKCFVMRIL